MSSEAQIKEAEGLVGAALKEADLPAHLMVRIAKALETWMIAHVSAERETCAATVCSSCHLGLAAEIDDDGDRIHKQATGTPYLCEAADMFRQRKQP